MSTAQTVYEVRQTFGEFGCGRKKTFKTLAEAEADRRVLAAGSQGSFTIAKATMPTCAD